MSVKFRLEGGGGGHVANVVDDVRHPPGVMAYTHPIDHYSYSIVPLTNPDSGTDMAVDPTSATTAETLIHNGEDTAAWTAADVTGGGYTFNSTAQALDGTQSVDATGSSNNDAVGFTAPSALNPSLYTSFSTGIYITAFDTRGTKDVTFQFYNGGAAVGTAVSIKPYVNTGSFNNWQIANIPFGDFNLSGVALIDELRVTTIDTGPGNPPDFYLDSLKLIQSVTGSGVAEFRFEPDFEENYALLRLRIFAYNTGKTAANPTEFFGLTALTNGFELVLRNKKRVLLSLVARDVWDFIRAPNSNVQTNADGSTGATFVVDFDIPLEHMLVEGAKGTFLEVRIRDDLTGLSRLETSLHLAKLEG